jgi:5-methylcytosine-specific restriction endonuclease McrA
MTFPSSRRFSRSDRAALFVAAGGVCQRCGRQLDNSFHADHVKPWSAGGTTDVLNGQALCAGCNLRKGAKL